MKVILITAGIVFTAIMVVIGFIVWAVKNDSDVDKAIKAEHDQFHY
jgi:hypothetical protein